MTTTDVHRNGRWRPARLLIFGLAMALITPMGCGGDDDDVSPQNRVDLETPAFSKPTSVTNPLLPVSQLHSLVMLGKDDGKPLRIEITLLPRTRTLEWEGKKIEVLVSQLTAYEDGRIHEVALDHFAQADDGSVWYFGEDTAFYEDGVRESTEGSWLAGKDGPPAMIMAAEPKVGDVFRPEDIPDLVFEEFTVKSTGVKVDGPRGPVEGAIVVKVRQHDENEEKTFVPGYGEFAAGAGGDSEVMALAVPTDAVPGDAPAELDLLRTGATRIFEALRSGNWDAASRALDEMQQAWSAFRDRGGVPKLLDTQMRGALDALVAAVAAKKPVAAGGALAVEQAALDLLLRHRPPAQIDMARFGLWVDQLELDMRPQDPDPVFIAAASSTLDAIWARFVAKIDPAQAGTMDTQLVALRAAAENEDVAAARNLLPALRKALTGLTLT